MTYARAFGGKLRHRMVPPTITIKSEIPQTQYSDGGYVVSRPESLADVHAVYADEKTMVIRGTPKFFKVQEMTAACGLLPKRGFVDFSNVKTPMCWECMKHVD